MSVEERIIKHILDGWSVGFACGKEGVNPNKFAKMRLLNRDFDEKIKEIAPEAPMRYVYPRKRQGPLKAEMNVHPIYFDIFGY